MLPQAVGPRVVLIADFANPFLAERRDYGYVKPPLATATVCCLTSLLPLFVRACQEQCMLLYLRCYFAKAASLTPHCPLHSQTPPLLLKDSRLPILLPSPPPAHSGVLSDRSSSLTADTFPLPPPPPPQPHAGPSALHPGPACGAAAGGGRSGPAETTGTVTVASLFLLHTAHTVSIESGQVKDASRACPLPLLLCHMHLLYGGSVYPYHGRIASGPHSIPSLLHTQARTITLTRMHTHICTLT